MKNKILTTIVFVFMIIFIFEFTFEVQDKKDYNKLICIGEKQGSTYSLLLKENYTIQYDQIIKYLDIYNANMYATKINNAESEKNIVKYVYINDFTYFQNITFQNGRFFNKDEMESDSNIYVFDVYNLFDAVSAEIGSVQNSLKYIMIIMICLIIILIAISIQNITVYFIELSNYISVFHLLGYPTFSKNSLLYINLAISSFLISTISFIIIRKVSAIPLIFIFILAELLFTVVTAEIYEKRNIVYLLKQKS